MKNQDSKAIFRDTISIVLEAHLKMMDIEKMDLRKAFSYFSSALGKPDVMALASREAAVDLDLLEELTEYCEDLLQEDELERDSYLTGVSKIKSGLKGFH